MTKPSKSLSPEDLAEIERRGRIAGGNLRRAARRTARALCNAPHLPCAFDTPYADPEAKAKWEAEHGPVAPPSSD